ncbi:ABC transporter ATP-binding protein [Psychromonas aquimarina]|uniref:ABC transporter ATP-binding protein n=1 Tax=Psychromonas aquimarina TaxID=444919 RepID=UPI0004255DC6|nr:dipeptide ABC transporter ATP-binding protein [Psychromonas aquimarina]
MSLDNAGLPLLKVQDLSVSFAQLKVVECLNFELQRGKTLALVGESGSGKSVTALSILQLLPYPHAHHEQGEIYLSGQAVVGKGDKVLQAIRGNKVSMIFQEPMTSLNPLHTIKKQIAEALLLHKGLTGKPATKRIIELLELVGLDNAESRLSSYPHELSGGQRQRVMIAMALANEPELLIADEPTTALDVTIQKQILELLKSLQKRLNMGILLITHDLHIVRNFADDVVVMCDGRQIEYNKTESLFTTPQQSYTKKLLSSEPQGQMPALQRHDLILSAENINVSFPLSKNFWGKVTSKLYAVKNAGLQVHQGETVAIVGESGAGKSTLAQAVLQLNDSEGKVVYLGQRIDQLKNSAMRRIRSSLQIVFQDPFASLSPRMSVHEIVAEGLRVHSAMDETQIELEVQRVLAKVGLDKNSGKRYPHEFSGGQRQRISIARALILKPKLIVLDEPTSALDRTIQKQILELLIDLQKEFSLSYIFISHDLSVVRAVSHRVVVMQAGKIIEQGLTSEIFGHAQEKYTQILLSSAAL